MLYLHFFSFFFFNDTATTEIYTLSLHDALPISVAEADANDAAVRADAAEVLKAKLNLQYCFVRSPLDGRTGGFLVHQGNLIKANENPPLVVIRSEEHTSELQSRLHLVCRLLLEKKKNKI